LTFPGPLQQGRGKRDETHGHPLFIIAAIAAGLAASILILVLIAASSEPALAAFPGTNGKIAFTSDRDGNQEIYQMNPDDTSQVNLTRSLAERLLPELLS